MIILIKLFNNELFNNELFNKIKVSITYDEDC